MSYFKTIVQCNHQIINSSMGYSSCILSPELNMIVFTQDAEWTVNSLIYKKHQCLQLDLEIFSIIFELRHYYLVNFVSQSNLTKIKINFMHSFFKFLFKKWVHEGYI